MFEEGAAAACAGLFDEKGFAAEEDEAACGEWCQGGAKEGGPEEGPKNCLAFELMASLVDLKRTETETVAPLVCESGGA